MSFTISINLNIKFYKEWFIICKAKLSKVLKFINNC